VRILAAADLHGHLDLYDWLIRCSSETGPDALVLAGDLLATQGDHPGPIEAAHAECARLVVERLERVAAPVFFVMGNDDMAELESRDNRIRSVHARRVELGEFNFAGYQHSLPFMGGINEKPEEEIRRDLQAITELVDERTILVTHSPAYGVLDQGLMDHHAGSRSILDLIADRKPAAHIHGHIHSKFGREGVHFNVAAAGRKRAVLIDLGTMSHRVVE
jgi:Icc-related predicted phosphoesterase